MSYNYGNFISKSCPALKIKQQTNNQIKAVLVQSEISPASSKPRLKRYLETILKTWLLLVLATLTVYNSQPSFPILKQWVLLLPGSHQSPPLGPQIFQSKENVVEAVLSSRLSWQMTEFHRSPQRNYLIVAKSAVADCDDSIIYKLLLCLYKWFN